MTQEQKDLLLKDLCSRLPYGVKGVNLAGIVSTPSEWYCAFDILGGLIYKIEGGSWRSYLFPLSSMTEGQRREYDSLKHRAELHTDRYYDVIDIDEFKTLQDFYHKYHFDYTGLIPLFSNRRNKLKYLLI